MADEVKRLSIPAALYDYVLFFECASKDWKKGAKKSTIKGDGSLMDLINWNSTYSYDEDDKGGKTLFGVTEAAWQGFVSANPNQGYSTNLNSMGKRGWLAVMERYWSTLSKADLCPNYACAFALFQMRWGGFTESSQKKLLNKLKENADKKDYPFITSGGYYRKIADACHAFTDPMKAYEYLRKAKSTYLYNISTPDRTNKKYRMGWLNRNVLPFTLYGLYIPTNFGGKNIGLKYESTLKDWYEKVNNLIESGKEGYIRIMDWGADPETIAKISATAYDYSDVASSGGYYGTSSGAYVGCGGVGQLGSYGSSISEYYSGPQVEHIQSQNREEVLNTLVKGSYESKSINKCLELISVDKKKNRKKKSES